MCLPKSLIKTLRFDNCWCDSIWITAHATRYDFKIKSQGLVSIQAPYHGASVGKKKIKQRKAIVSKIVPMQYLMTSYLAASSCVFKVCISCSSKRTCSTLVWKLQYFKTRLQSTKSKYCGKIHPCHSNSIKEEKDLEREIYMVFSNSPCPAC